MDPYPERKCLRRFALALAVAMALLLSGVPIAKSAFDLDCAQADVQLTVEEPTETDLVCAAAGAAINFMKSIGIRQRAPVKINVVSQIPGEQPEAIGCHDRTTDTVYIRGSSACVDDSAGPTIFGLRGNTDLYGSLVAHEVAHAVSARNFGYSKPSVTAQEYIAAVVQLSVMDQKPRRAFLDHFPGDGFDSPSEITLLAYQLDPARFIAESYRHFHKQKDGAGFVADLLSGTIKLRDGIWY